MKVSRVAAKAAAYVTSNETEKLTFDGVLLATKWYNALEATASVIEKYEEEHRTGFTHSLFEINPLGGDCNLINDVGIRHAQKLVACFCDGTVGTADPCPAIIAARQHPGGEDIAAAQRE